MSAESIKICKDCNEQLTQIDDLFNKARNLERLFTGISEESDADLTIVRLNAYREHFKLKDKITEVNNSEFEYIEYKIEDEETELEYETTEIIERIEEFNDDAIIQEEDYGVAEEIYLEGNESIESEDAVFTHESQQQLINFAPIKPRNLDSIEKSEEEKLFIFQCHVCLQPEFTNMKLLSVHCKTLHNCLPLVKCCSEECDAKLSTWRRLLIHKEKHFPNSDGSKLRCGECNR